MIKENENSVFTVYEIKNKKKGKSKFIYSVGFFKDYFQDGM